MRDKHSTLREVAARAFAGEPVVFGYLFGSQATGAPLPIRGRVIRDGKVLYSRDDAARVLYQSKTLREFFDFEIHSRPLDEKFLSDIAAGRR